MIRDYFSSNDMGRIGVYEGNELWAPNGFWVLSDEAIQENSNGCGANGVFSLLVPNTFWGLNVKSACTIHDICYQLGKTEDDRIVSDRVFRNNLIRIVLTNTKWSLLRWLRLRRAEKYYRAVRMFGAPSFWADKNLTV